MSKLSIHPIDNNNIQEQTASELNMTEFKSVLETAIYEWQIAERKRRGNHFDAYKELAIMLGLHYATVRAYVDEFNKHFIPVDRLVALCRLINDKRPIEYLNK